jgi:hypothetical protein
MNRSRYRGSLSTEEVRGLHEKGLLKRAMREGYLPVMAGGVTSYPDAIVNPLSGPTISTTTFTVDFLLQNPTIIRREIADKVMQNFFLDKVFDIGGDVQGGAALYEQVTTLDVYTDRDVERVQPGAEFPIVTGARIAPLVALVEKFGGKFPVTDEAKRRNDVGRVTNQMRRLANTITRKMQQRGIAELEAAITAFSRTTAAAVTWKASAEEAMLNRVALKAPTAVIYKAMELMENLEMGYDFDTLIINPADAYFINTFYGEQGRAKAAFADLGITNVIKTPRKAAKSAILTAGKQVGQMRLEAPMRTTIDREGAPLLREQSWVQTAINPLFVVTDPYAALEITNLS